MQPLIYFSFGCSIAAITIASYFLIKTRGLAREAKTWEAHAVGILIDTIREMYALKNRYEKDFATNDRGAYSDGLYQASRDIAAIANKSYDRLKANDIIKGERVVNVDATQTDPAA